MTVRHLYLLALLFSLVWPVTAGASTPKQDISGTVDNILVVLRNHELSAEQRREQLSNLIRQRFEFTVMSRSTLGKNWRKASTEQRQEFMKLFSDLLEATYLGRIESYTNEQVLYGEEKVRGKKALVKTLIKTKTVEIPIDYKLVRKENSWFVYDVVIEGVSLVRNFRSSYNSIVAREGFDGLFGKMRTKIAELRK
ncbi:toluene tolerance protein [Geothermobacter hydrogeniphilus]|uniref:Toluene tolerance protein n=1 Tax=Geothermobacter hydrogeniphilus TaxID=1969733 RepID=A0A2K2HC47_9BACT|nr:ABC transporter substrate-binding protein [Geothermobacter hydrogeniphilus]PNU20789.1 toluene tolerance protein [Geothermobacter hydrogeniphilus]